MYESFSRWVVTHRLLVILGWVLIVAAAGYGASKLGFKNNYRMFFSEQNPQLVNFEALQNTYTKNDNVLFTITPKDGEVFTRKTLQTIKWLTKESWQIPYSIRVDSLTNFQHTEAEGDDLAVADLFEKPAKITDAELKRRRAIALQEPLLVNRIVSPDGKYTGVNVTVQLPGKHVGEVPEIAAFVRDLAKKVMARDPNIEVRLTGMVMMNNSFPEAAKKDMGSLYPIMFAVVLVVLALLLRSISGVISTIFVIVLMVISTMGLTGWLGIKMSPPTTSVPVVIMTLAIADCVHILVNFLHGMRMGMDKQAAMLESLRLNKGPVFLTSITTAIGFLSLNFSDAPPFRDLGNMSAMGVMLAYLLSISLLPAMMMLLPVKKVTGDTVGSKTMERFADFVIANRNRLFWVSGAVILLLVVQIPRNVLNDQFVNYFSEKIAFRADTDYTSERLTGIYLIEYSVPSKGPNGVSDPEYLANLERFANWYREQPEVIHVNALTDIMKRLNKNMHGDDPAWYRIPDARDLSAQYLLLYEFSLPFGLDLNNQINVKKSATKMSVLLKTITSAELLALEDRVQAWLKANTPDYFRSTGASPTVMFAHIGQRNIVTMLEGTSVALVLISGILIFALRSFRIGLLSLIPNLVPIASAFGIWAMFVGQIGLALSVVSGMTLGIVVDDTVHFLSKYLRARRERGLDAQAAVRYAFSTVGTALWVTSIVLVLGFLVLSLSNFELNAGMGLLTAITIAAALVADFFFLPTLLMKFGDSKDAQAEPAAESV